MEEKVDLERKIRKKSILKIEILNQKVEIREENIIPSEYDDSLKKSIQLQIPSLILFSSLHETMQWKMKIHNFFYQRGWWLFMAQINSKLQKEINSSLEKKLPSFWSSACWIFFYET
jgi:hypothetical protein